MVQKGEVALADPVAKHLSPSVRLPKGNGRSITLLDLATHTSGLPFMPEVPAFKDSDQLQAPNPQLYQFLASYEPRRESGARWNYSNIGYWLLGEALASRAGVDFESLLRARVSSCRCS